MLIGSRKRFKILKTAISLIINGASIVREQALLFRRAKRASPERSSEGPRIGQLATISHKFAFPPRKPRNTAKRESGHRKRPAD